MLSKLRLNKINKNVMDSDLTPISNVFPTFYFDTIRLHVFQVKQNATHLSQHDSLKGAYVHEMTLCVASGALGFWSSFASWLRSCDTLDFLLGQLGPQDRLSTCGQVTSVGKSAMHMQRLDDIWREAGIGRTQDRKELSYSGLTRIDWPSVG